MVLQGKEAIDNYLTKRLRKPKHTSIRLHKFEEKLLHIDIPAGKFRNKYRFVIAIFSLATNVLFLLIFLVVFLSLILSALKIYYFSLTALSFMMGAISILFPVIIYTLTISKNLIVNPLSHIEYTLSKTENYYIFACQKSLFSLRYRNSQKRCSFDNKVLETILRKKISSIKFNLTVEEYRWLKSEIDNFIK